MSNQTQKVCCKCNLGCTHVVGSSQETVNKASCGALLVFLCVHATAAAAVVAEYSCCKAVAVQLEALGLLAVAPLGTTASKALSLYALQQSQQCQYGSEVLLSRYCVHLTCKTE